MKEFFGTGALVLGIIVTLASCLFGGIWIAVHVIHDPWTLIPLGLLGGTLLVILGLKMGALQGH